MPYSTLLRFALEVTVNSLGLESEGLVHPYTVNLIELPLLKYEVKAFSMVST